MIGVEQEAPDALLTVGLVARRSGLTAKALRHSDRIGLLRPVRVDGGTGYRLWDWDLAFAFEALARAHAIAGDVAEDEERDLVLADLETIPGQPRYW